MSVEKFDAVIVGSGFGGSVMAYRLADAGMRVCLLERGRAYPPGSFPRTPSGMKQNFWDPSEGLFGLFDLWSFKKIEAMVSSGLGGGSLIYANVLLRKDEKWFVKEDLAKGGYEHWPISRQDLNPHYDRVEKMMGTARYPFHQEPYNETLKTGAFIEAADKLNLNWHHPPLAVTFGNEGEAPETGEPIGEAHRNLHNKTRYTCTLCGECDLGCNYGSKNTLDFNYLSEAKRLGADIRTLHEVRSFTPYQGGYEVTYVKHDLDMAGKPSNTRDMPLHRMQADRLILAAGALGSTYLMLKNREALPEVSKRLGSRFCGNGDLLSFIFDAKQKNSETGMYGPRVLNPNHGPVITTTIRKGDSLDEDGSEGRGFYLQDAGYPSFLSWVAESVNTLATVKRTIRLMKSLVMRRLIGDTNFSSEIQEFIGGRLSSTTVPLLGMGRDFPDGTLNIVKDKRGVPRLVNDWHIKTSQTYFDSLKKTMKDMARALDGKFIVNPTWMLKRVITVHPLGGCPMGRSCEEGVVDSYGEVFNYDKLYVTDGSILPGPSGPNPALTIAAVADRSADSIIEKYKSKNRK
ncbi:GMC oxidoreductase [Roseivirga sp. BDSF3-8]|uniref:GMC oxidoreductase n=1 Tax=Roseivirga sp. BDSF3-8 TaxID=3241598 RepID=UPI003532064C